MQLKKYVGAVQMLRREGQTVEGKDEMKREKTRSHRLPRVPAALLLLGTASEEMTALFL